MRYVIYGAGAVGGVIGAKLFMRGREVVLIARGEHLRAIQANGLRLQHPQGEVLLPVPAVGRPSEIEFHAGDVVFLTMKAQDTNAALTDLLAAAGDQVPVVCCQNGVDNERMALRLFEDVYGVCVFLPAGYLEPGLVDATVWPVSGALDVGRCPEGVDALAEAIAGDLTGAGFISRPEPKILRLKYGKLLHNVQNVVQAVCGRGVPVPDLAARLQSEAEACFAAAGMDYAGTEEMSRRSADIDRFLANRSGNSTWQSLARGAGSIEVDYLNGEIVLLGRLHGVPTPANAAFQRLANEMARQRREPGSVSVEEMRRAVAAREAIHTSGG